MLDNIQKTTEEKLKDLIIELKTIINSGIINLKNANQQAYDLIWKNQEFTAEQIFDFLGQEETLKLFTNSEKSQNFIKDMDPTHEKLQAPDSWNM